MMTTPTIHTPRLTLRPFTLADIEPLHQILSEPDILRFFPRTDPPDIERVGKIIQRQLTHWEENHLGWWAVVPKEGTELIGWNGLQFLADSGETEVGYLLSKSFWGLGYATEGARAALKYGFETMNLGQIIGLTHPENTASQNVLKKCGLRYTGQKEYFGMQLLRFSLQNPTQGSH
jgi:ribosomal-protein-alanine N-acetyltransferase